MIEKASSVLPWRMRLRGRFYLAMAAAMLAVVILGFSRTLFFRPFFDVPEIPLYLFVHGVVVTLWFVWFVVQTSLVAARRVQLHRRLGIAGIAIAVCVVAVSLFTTLSYVPRMRSLGTDIEAQYVDLGSVVLSDLLGLAIFSTLILLAFSFRHRAQVHKRLMFFASIPVIGPAVVRVPRSLEALDLDPGTVGLLSGITTLFVVSMLLGPVLYDVITRRWPHIVTLVCVPTIAIAGQLGNVLASTEFARKFIVALG